MGARGPQKTPTKLLADRGSHLAKSRPNEPVVPVGKPLCPEWLKEPAKQYWQRMVYHLSAMRLLSEVDENMMARYCQTLAKWEDTEEYLEKNTSTFIKSDRYGNEEVKLMPHVALSLKLADQLLRMEREFGFSPSSRANIGALGQIAQEGTKLRFFKKMDYDADVEAREVNQ